MATNTTASFTSHTGNGSAGPFSISFSYLSEAEVDVTVGGVLKTITTHYTFTSATQITFTSGNEPGNGVAIKFQRDTNISSKKVDFNDASILTESDLDTQNDQLLFAQQEVLQKLDTIEENATADQSDAEIRAAVEAATDSNVFTDADHNKLNAIEDNATADQTAAEIRALVESATDSNVFTDADHNKLNAIDASADVTDATTVNAAGAVMNSDLDVKGELLVGDGSGDPTALPVGTDTHVLTADSSEATGVKWAAIPGASGEANQNAFSTIAVSGEDNVVADSTTDTLNITAGSNVTITTDASTDTVTIASTDTNTQLTTEEVQDIVGAMFSGNTETNITATYQDGDGTIDLVSTDTNTTDLASDSSPQLAANLDVQSNEITTSTSNGNIKLNPNGSGVVEVKGDGTTDGTVGTIQLNCSNNSHGVKIASPPHSAAASYTLTLPNDDGDPNQVLKTDGSGGLDWVDQPTANATHTGEVTGSTSLTIADNVVDEANLKVSNAPTDGYVLTAQSGNSGGLTWAAQSSGGGLNSDSDDNTLGGTNAGDSITDGTDNTFLGKDAGTAITGGSTNTFIGNEAGSGASGSGNCVAVGHQSLQSSTTVYLNTAIGTQALKATTASRNAACGYQAGYQGTSHTDGVYMGYKAGGFVSSGTKNVLIGYEAGANSGANGLTTGSNNILIGADTVPSSQTVSNEITLGNSSIATLRCNTQTISSLSDKRDKTNINTLDLGLNFIKSLKPVKFEWKTRDGNGKDGSCEAGFIAQDFQQIQKDNDAEYLKLVIDENPDRLEASYGKLIPILVKAIQELTIEVEKLKSNG